MFALRDYFDRQMFIVFCISVLFFTIANLAGTTYLCYRADCPVESIDQNTPDAEQEEVTDTPVNFRHIVETYVRRQYSTRSRHISSLQVEWSLERSSGFYQGKAVIRGIPVDFYGKLAKFNTGWKCITFHEE